jgi:hypothetical protein
VVHRNLGKIPPDASAAFVANMEDVLEVYQRPHDPQRPLVRDGKQVAGPVSVPIGTDQRTLKDPTTGKEIGQEIYAAAQKAEGQITETNSYMFPKPGTTAPLVAKVSFVTRVGDLGCGVGYYK